MKIKVGVASLRNYKRMPYTLWYALGELVDNSIQAYLDEKKDMDKIFSAEGKKLKISINYDKHTDSLTISDTSTGITEKRLEQAMEIGGDMARPMGDKSLGEFNVGLKSSAIWLCDLWTITTKRFDEHKETTVMVDNDNVFANNDELEVDTKDVPTDRHYTKITFEKLSHKFDKRHLDKTKMFLASMYRNYLNKSVYISFNDDDLEWEPFELHNNPKTNKPFKWVIGPGMLGGTEQLEVSGWIGILKMGAKKGSSAANAGISVMRRNRMIIGYPDAWRPKNIFASGMGSTINQRIVGEIVFNDAKVSHTKDAISPEHMEIMDVYLGDFAKQNGIVKEAKKIQAEANKPTKSESDEVTESIGEVMDESDIGDIAKEPIAPTEVIDNRIEQVFQSTSKDEVQTYNLKNFLIKIVSAHLGEDKPYVAYKKISDTEIKAVINNDHPFLANSYVDFSSYYLMVIMQLCSRFKIEKDARYTMDDFFEVLDQMMRFKTERK
jgi:hypothetical protein